MSELELKQKFFAGRGEMAQNMRATDWATSDLGPVGTWPVSLLTTLGILLNSRFPMFLFWGADHFCFYNDAYRPSLGRDGKHPGALGMKGEEVWPEIWETIGPLIDQVMSGGPATWSEDQLIPIYRNGRMEDVYWTFSYSPVLAESGEPAGVFVTCTETTETVHGRLKTEENERKLDRMVEEKTRDLTDANLKLQRSNEELEQFAYVASHDLQEPLRKISAFGEMLKNRYEDTLDKDGLNLIERMQLASDRMKDLIDDLLSYSHTSTSAIANEDVNLDQLVREVLSDLETVIQEKKAIISCKPLPQVKGDARQLRQLFQNLLSNALKFTRKDEPALVAITSEAARPEQLARFIPLKDKRKEFLLIEVTDNGIGFEEQYAERIFQLFQRLNGRSEYPGSGMGLAIVKKIVDNHNGYVYASGEPGKGSKFSLLLPVRYA